MGTKNNPKNRDKGANKAQYNGKDVEPIKYIGTNANHGSYMATKYSGGDIVEDKDRKPMAWNLINKI